MVCDHTNENSRLLIEVASLANENSEEAIENRLALVLLTGIDDTREVSVDRVSALYSLTHAESAVFKLLANGCSTQEIADARNVQPHTVISQIKSILHKTGSRERIDLVKLLINTSSI